MRLSGGPVRVLIVLESPLTNELAEPAFHTSGYTTRRAVIPSEVAAAVAEWPPHVILHMDHNGGQIMRQVACSAAHLPVIGLTQQGDLKTKLAAFEAGVDDILIIPFDPQELLARSIALLRRSSASRFPSRPRSEWVKSRSTS